MADTDIYLVSTSNLNHHPENSMTAFSNNLPEELDLRESAEGSWHVALKSLFFDGHFSNFPRLPKADAFVYFLHTQPNIPGSDYPLHNVAWGDVYRGPTTHLGSHAELMRRLNISLKWTTLLNKHIRFVIAGGRVSIGVNNNEGYMFLHRRLAQTIGMRKIAMSSYPPEVGARLEMVCSQHSTARGSLTAFERIYGIYDLADAVPNGGGTYVIASEMRTRLGYGFPESVNVCFDEVLSYPTSSQIAECKILHQGAINSKKPGTFEMSPEKPAYFRIRPENGLKSMSIKLVDEEGVQLALQAGQASIVQLSLRRMEPFQASAFHVLIRSNDNYREHPENVASAFTASFASTIQLNPSPTYWSCALHSLSMPLEFIQLQVPAIEAWVGVRSFPADPEDPHFSPANFRQDQFASNAKLVEAVAAEISALDNNVEMSLLAGGKVRIQCGTAGGREISFPKTLAYLLGAAPHPSHDAASRITFRLRARRSKTLEMMADYRRFMPHNVLVYCDILAPTMVGDHHSKLLKIVHIPRHKLQDLYAHNVTFDSKHLDEKRIAVREIGQISFQLRTMEGHLLPFWDEKNKSATVLLSFQRRM